MARAALWPWGILKAMFIPMSACEHSARPSAEWRRSTPNRQPGTELVGCGLARPAPNWSRGWQRIINRELGRMAGRNVRKAALDSLRKTVIIRSGFEALYFSAAHHLMRPFVGGIGAI